MTKRAALIQFTLVIPVSIEGVVILINSRTNLEAASRQSMFVPALGILFCLGLISAYPANFYLWAVVIYLALLLAITLRVWAAATIDAI